jgi:aquaporin Z
MSGRDGAAVPPSPEDAARARRVAEIRRHEVGLRSLGQPNAMARQFDFADDSYEWRRLFSEIFGTFLLVLVAAGGPMVNARFGGSAISGTALVVAPGMMVLAIILFMGAVSGAHLNPGVTIAFTLRGDFPLRRVPMYILAQFAGAVLATLVLVGLVGKQGTAGLTLPGSGISTVVAMTWEAVLTVGLVSVILGTASGAQQIGGMAAIGVGSYGASIAIVFAQILRGSGGGTFGRRAAQGTLGTIWLPGRPGHPAGPPGDSDPGDGEPSHSDPGHTDPGQGGPGSGGPGGGGDDEGGDEGQAGRH